MQVELHNGFRSSVTTPATRVLITDDFGNPILFAIQESPNHIRCSVVSDPEFAALLQESGITRTTQVTSMQD